jgi:hypothetical protein
MCFNKRGEGVVAIIAYDEPERRPDYKRNDQWKRNNRRSSLLFLVRSD